MQTLQALKIANLLHKEVGKPVTLFVYSEFGFPSAHKALLTKVAVESYAQYRETIVITFTPKGKRKARAYRIYPYTSMLIYAGHVDLNAEMYGPAKTDSGVTTRQSIGTCFDNVYMERAILSTEETPIVHLTGENFELINY